MPSAVPHAAPTAAPDAARGPFPGLLALEGGLVLSGALHGSRLPADGDLVFTTAATLPAPNTKGRAPKARPSG